MPELLWIRGQLGYQDPFESDRLEEDKPLVASGAQGQLRQGRSVPSGSMDSWSRWKPTGRRARSGLVRGVVNRSEHVEPAKQHVVDAEEVARDQARRLSGEELCPG
jgi:hypothetical protein